MGFFFLVLIHKTHVSFHVLELESIRVRIQHFLYRLELFGFIILQENCIEQPKICIRNVVSYMIFSKHFYTKISSHGFIYKKRFMYVFIY